MTPEPGSPRAIGAWNVHTAIRHRLDGSTVSGVDHAQAGPHLPARVPVVPVVIIAAIVLSGLFTGHPGLIVLVPVLALITVRRLTGTDRRRRASR